MNNRFMHVAAWRALRNAFYPYLVAFVTFVHVEEPVQRASYASRRGSY